MSPELIEAVKSGKHIKQIHLNKKGEWLFNCTPHKSFIVDRTFTRDEVLNYEIEEKKPKKKLRDE